MLNKKISQAQLLFPASLYPIHSAYINLLLEQIHKNELDVASLDVEILSIALGHRAKAFYQKVESHKSKIEKIDSLIAEGLGLKVSTKKRLTNTKSELNIDANKGVIELVLNQYQSQLDEAAAIKQANRLAEQLKLQQEKQAKLDTQQKQLKLQREIHEANHMDFEYFDIYGIKKNSRVARLLSTLRKSSITEEDLNWLIDKGFCNDIVQKNYFLQLGHKHYQNWRQNKLPWELVNASATYRKADQQIQIQKIKQILDQVYPYKEVKNDKKLKSALLTTHGGVCRDLKQYVQGIKLAKEAHQCTPLNFRPCTLLGAIYLSIGEFTLGHEWYELAMARGFTQAGYDNDIKSVYFRASDEIKIKLKQNLIATGHKYKWLR